MRRTIAAGLLLFCALPAVFAQIDPLLARIRLTKMEVITQKQFREQIERLEESLRRELSRGEVNQILQALIDEKVLLQAAEREGIRATSSEVDRAMDVYKRDLARQLRRQEPLTDSELRQLLEQQGSDMESFTEQVRNKLLIDKLIAEEQKPILEAIEEPSTADVLDVYESNKTKYPIVSPEMVRFKQILLVTSSLEGAEAASARTKAEEIYRLIQNGQPFDKFQEVFLENGGSRSRIGGLSFETWRRDDETKRATYGREFLDQLFRLGEGQRSAVLRSNVGLHIVEVIEKIPFKILELDDPIPPQNAKTVREHIIDTLKQRQQLEAIRRATENLVEDLRAEAEIRVNEELLDW